MDIQTQTTIMSAASEYANGAVAALTKKLGHEPNDQELMIFVSALSSLSGSWAYSKVYENGGLKPADTWMQQIFAQINMGLQARDVPVTLQITLKSTETGGAQKPQSQVAPQKNPAVICKCVTDDKGVCASCNTELYTDLGTIMDYAATLSTFQGKERCQACVVKLFDNVLSKVITEKYAGIAPEMRDMMTALSIQMGSEHGVVEFPKVEAAIQALNPPAQG